MDTTITTKHLPSGINNNCLANMCCPACGHEKEFVIEAVMWVGVTDGGTDPHADSTKNMGGTSWDNDSGCRCSHCGHQGTVGSFTFTEEESKPTILENLKNRLAAANLYYAIEEMIREHRDTETENLIEDSLVPQLEYLLKHRHGGSISALSMAVEQILSEKEA